MASSSTKTMLLVAGAALVGYELFIKPKTAAAGAAGAGGYASYNPGAAVGQYANNIYNAGYQAYQGASYIYNDLANWL